MTSFSVITCGKTANTMSKNILIRETTPEELKSILKEMIQEEFKAINNEVQRVIGEDDLISSGTACRHLGVCSKVFRILVQRGHFTIFHHLKERRFVRGEILAYRNQYRTNKTL